MNYHQDSKIRFNYGFKKSGEKLQINTIGPDPYILIPEMDFTPTDSDSIFVSGDTGSSANAGTYASPLDTIQNGIDACDADHGNVIIIDSEDYYEQLDVHTNAYLGGIFAYTSQTPKIIYRTLDYTPTDSNTVFVSKSGDDSNAGTEAAPVLTLAYAKTLLTSSKTEVMILDSETYEEPGFSMGSDENFLGLHSALKQNPALKLLYNNANHEKDSLSNFVYGYDLNWIYVNSPSACFTQKDQIFILSTQIPSSPSYAGLYYILYDSTSKFVFPKINLDEDGFNLCACCNTEDGDIFIIYGEKENNYARFKVLDGLTLQEKISETSLFGNSDSRNGLVTSADFYSTSYEVRISSAHPWDDYLLNNIEIGGEITSSDVTLPSGTTVVSVDYTTRKVTMSNKPGSTLSAAQISLPIANGFFRWDAKYLSICPTPEGYIAISYTYNHPSDGACNFLKIFDYNNRCYVWTVYEDEGYGNHEAYVKRQEDNLIVIMRSYGYQSIIFKEYDGFYFYEIGSRGADISAYYTYAEALAAILTGLVVLEDGRFIVTIKDPATYKESLFVVNENFEVIRYVLNYFDEGTNSSYASFCTSFMLLNKDGDMLYVNSAKYEMAFYVTPFNLDWYAIVATGVNNTDSQINISGVILIGSGDLYQKSVIESMFDASNTSISQFEVIINYCVIQDNYNAIRNLSACWMGATENTNGILKINIKNSILKNLGSGIVNPDKDYVYYPASHTGSYRVNIEASQFFQIQSSFVVQFTAGVELTAGNVLQLTIDHSDFFNNIAGIMFDDELSSSSVMSDDSVNLCSIKNSILHNNFGGHTFTDPDAVWSIDNSLCTDDLNLFILSNSIFANPLYSNEGFLNIEQLDLNIKTIFCGFLFDSPALSISDDSKNAGSLDVLYQGLSESLTSILVSKPPHIDISIKPANSLLKYGQDGTPHYNASGLHEVVDLTWEGLNKTDYDMLKTMWISEETEIQIVFDPLSSPEEKIKYKLLKDDLHGAPEFFMQSDAGVQDLKLIFTKALI